MTGATYLFLELPFSCEVHHSLRHVIKMLQHLSGAVRSTGYGIINDHGTNTGGPFNKLIQTEKKASAAGHNDSICGKISDQFRRSTLQCVMNCFHDGNHRFSEHFKKLG